MQYISARSQLFLVCVYQSKDIKNLRFSNESVTLLSSEPLGGIWIEAPSAIVDDGLGLDSSARCQYPVTDFRQSHFLTCKIIKMLLLLHCPQCVCSVHGSFLAEKKQKNTYSNSYWYTVYTNKHHTRLVLFSSFQQLTQMPLSPLSILKSSFSSLTVML